MALGLGRLPKVVRNVGLAALAATALTFWLRPSTSQAGPDPFYGMVLAPTVDAARAIPQLHDLGVNTVRLRTDVIDWANPAANVGTSAQDAAFAQTPVLHAAGFRVVLLVASARGGIPSYARARAVFSWLMARPGAAGVDVVEVLQTLTEAGTDPDAFSSTLTRDEQARRYVEGPLRAAWQVVHDGAGKRVLGGAFGVWQQSADLSPVGSWNLGVTAAYLRAGYLNYVDYAGLHPLVDRSGDQVSWVRRVRPLFGQTPVWISDWALRRAGYLSARAYTVSMTDALPPLRTEVKVACYDGFTPDAGSEGVVQSVFLGYHPAQPAFDTYRGWPKT